MLNQSKSDNSFLNGFLLVNKEAGCTSFDVVRVVNKITGMKAGHCGTLDPFATGLMLIAIGKATRFIEYLVNQDKEYIFDIRWGSDTDSYDITGNVIKKSDLIPKKADIKLLIKSFIGKQKQLPPMFSALKINGRRAYDYARKGEKITLSKRDIDISNFELVNYSNSSARFKVNCSKGTYVRSLAHDLCKKLGCCGHVSFLHRTKIANFLATNSLTIGDIKDLYSNLDNNMDKIKKNILSIDQALYFLNNFTVDKYLYQKLQHGCKILIKDLPFLERSIIKLKFDGRFFAIAQYIDYTIKPKKILLT